MRAQLEAARARGDKRSERDEAVRLARWLASRDSGLDEATALARRALELESDATAGISATPELRMELSTWLENLGDAATAAHVLRPLAAAPRIDAPDAARLLIRVGVLHARAGDAAAAADAFSKAAAIHPTDAQSLELRGTLHAWAPEVVLAGEASDAYVEAAARRAAAGAVDAQIEDLYRAFDADPTSGPAVAALAAALTERHKLLAADEAWRAHATALLGADPKRAATVHARRRLHARAAEDVARALGAALDEGLDAHMVGEGADVMDDLLLRVGLLEPLAARLEIRAEATTGPTRAATLEELARLFAGALSRPDRAAAVRVLALAADPRQTEALVALAADASAKQDSTLLVEGLVRAIGAAGDGEDVRAARIEHARSLAVLAEDKLRDGALATWAHAAVLRLEPKDTAALAGLARNAERWETARREVETLERALDVAEGRARFEPLQMLASLLPSQPDEAARHAAVLAELVTVAGDDRRHLADAIRLARRREDFSEVARFAREQLIKAESPADSLEARLTLAAALRAMGEIQRANEATRSLLTEAPSNRRALAAAWVNAALADDARTRAGALEHLGAACSTPVRAVMLAVAADTLVAAGDAPAARHLAELACQTDPSSARSVAALAATVLGAHDRTAASALERGIHVVFARSVWCTALAEALEAMGELGFSVGWTQRGCALRPGDRRGVLVLLRRIVRARDGARLADALTWALSQPHPMGPLAEVVAQSLRDLVGLDTDRAAVLARRALDVCGARSPALREAMLEVADIVRDDAFAAVVLERSLAVDFSSDRADLVLMLVRRRKALGDLDGEARALARAAREGLSSTELEECLRDLVGARLSGDGEIARLEATAEVLSAGEDKDKTAAAFRELGAALWDLAGDRTGAVRAWLRAAKLVPRGFLALGMDLARFAGARYALDCLADLVEKEANPGRAGSLAAEAARAALALGDPERSFALSVLAIDRNPRLADALETAEKGAVTHERVSEMTRLYDAVAGAALGRFGRRAAHYRGARFFDKKFAPGLALKHAANAFQAVPSEGAAFILLKRMAERADDPTQALRTIVQVADATASPAARAGWLLRAAAVAGSDEDGMRMKVDVLLRAGLLSPDIGTLSMLEQATVELLRIAPGEKESIEMRLSRAARTITAKANGPDGARVAVRFAHMGLDLLSDDLMALRAVERALHADGDLEEYGALRPSAARLAQADGAGEVLEGLVELTERPYSNIGLPALELLIAMAQARKDTRSFARLAVTALEKDPEDEALVMRADYAVKRAPEPPLEPQAKDVGVLPARRLEARLDKVAPPAKRARVFRAWARGKSLDGAHDLAISALERASELSSDEERSGLQHELVVAYEASGRAEQIEELALAEANNEKASVALRALRWGEVADKREARGDLAGAVEALSAAAAIDGARIERWSALERVAELAGAEEARIHAIREIAARVEPDARVAVNKRLARAYASSGAAADAESTWQAISASDPGDEEADYALEALITARGDYAALAEHLAHRALRLSTDSGTREALRAVRLRRAVILEQRLARTRDACDELTRVLDESPDNLTALSYLADLEERLGEHARAAGLWSRVATLARDLRTQNEAGIRAARAALATKDYAKALLWAREVLAREPGRRDALELRVEAARSLRNDRELGDALEELAMASEDAASEASPPGHLAEGRGRSEVLLEASAAAARAGETHAALQRAQRAAELAPSYARAQLAARTIEYRARGAGTPEDARATVEELSRVEGPLQRDEAGVLAFLTAEALDAFQGGGAGLKLLIEKHEEIGSHPMLAVGIAERTVAKFDFAGALPYFQAALAGDALDLRDRGRVALAGADAAIRAGDHDVAIRLLEEAAIEGPTRSAALMRAAQLASSRGELAKASNILRDLADSTEGEERARALAQLGRLQAASSDPAETAMAASTLEAAVAAAPAYSSLRLQLAAEHGATRAAPAPVEGVRPPEPPPEPAAPTSDARPPFVSLPPSLPVPTVPEPPPMEVEDDDLEPPLPPAPVGPDVSVLEHAVLVAQTPSEASSARLELARGHLAHGAIGAAELCLQEGLARGGLEEGDMLSRLLEADSERASELVKVRRRLVELVPGDLARLEALRRAALVDRNVSYARAVDHVARSFDPGAGPLPPPALGAQSVQPGLLGLLTRASGDWAAQVLACVWEGAPGLFATEARGVALRGAERVKTGGTEPIARLYDAALRMLDIPRVPLFVRRGPGPLEAHVVLTNPPSALLTGFPNEDNTQVRFALGRALAGALPTAALAMGPEPADARAIWSALLAAFGPPESSRSVGRGGGKLAEDLWQALPPRTQRRLQSVLGTVGNADFEDAVRRARQAGSRVGLFLTGDFGAAARTLLLESLGEAAEPTTLVGESLRSVCVRSPAIVDLFLLAVSPEYADARWKPASSSQKLRRVTGGRPRGN